MTITLNVYREPYDDWTGWLDQWNDGSRYAAYAVGAPRTPADSVGTPDPRGKRLGYARTRAAAIRLAHREAARRWGPAPKPVHTVDVTIGDPA